MPRPSPSTDDYRPAPGIDRFLAGTPPILGLAALEGGARRASPASRWRALGQVHRPVRPVPRLDGRTLPRARLHHAARPGAARQPHLLRAIPHAFEICQALIADGVIGDFRAPDVLRFGLTPLYLGFEDVWRAVDILAEIMASGRWRDPEFAVRGKVT